jgi:hypothetical protein
MLETRIYNDCFNDVVVTFKSNAPQSFVTGLEFSGPWCVVKEILIDWGYDVVEIPKFNPN